MSLYQHFTKTLAQHHKGGRLLVAYSGGLDSHVSLHLAKRYAHEHGFEVLALHVHHGLQAIADTWPAHCQAQCEALGVALHVDYLTLTKGPRQSVEALAREARYARFEQHLGEGDSLLTGHHGDDQLETLLLNLKRGSGLSGLAAMPCARPLGQGQLLRPLLNSTRSELEAYAKAQGLSWIDDPSNQSHEFDRNYLRSAIVPALSQRWPQFVNNAMRSAQLLQEAQSLNEALAELDLATMAQANQLCLKGLSVLDAARQRNALRHWLKQQGVLYPSYEQLQDILNQAKAKDDATLRIVLGEYELRRFAQRFYVLKSATLNQVSTRIDWNMLNAPHLRIPHVGEYGWQQGGHLLPPCSATKVSIRFRSEVGNLSFDAAERAGRRDLKKLLQEMRLAPWQRERVPLLYYNDTLVAVGSTYTSREFYTHAPCALRLFWQP